MSPRFASDDRSARSSSVAGDPGQHSLDHWCKLPCSGARAVDIIVVMSATEPVEVDWAPGSRHLAVLLAMAMFVLVVDTSLMNVSIAAVVKDLDTTVSGVQGAIALEALVSAAFILIGSKVGDLIGRKRAFVLGLCGYAIGALAMAFAQGLTAIIVFWAVIGGLGASLLLPAMQSLIHGNFEGPAQKKAYAPGGRRGGDRRRRRSADRRLLDHGPVVAHRIPV